MRPLGVGEVIDAAINLYLRNFGKLAKTAAAVALPVFALVFLLNVIGLKEVSAFAQGAALYRVGDSLRVFNEDTVRLVTIAQALLTGLGSLLVIGATFKACSQAYLSRDFDERSSLGFALSKAPALLWLCILLVIGLGLALIALVLPFFWLVVCWSVAIPVLLIEGTGGFKAMARSFELTKGNWLRTFGALLVGLIAIALLQFIVSLVVKIFDGVATDHLTLFLLIRAVIASLAIIITAPLQAAIITVIYYDLRVRKEGFDVELLGQQLGAPPPPAPPIDSGTRAPDSPPPSGFDPPPGAPPGSST